MNKDARTKAVSTSARNKVRSVAARRAQETIRKAAARVRRIWYVLGGLALGLATTGALLKMMAPQPLTADAAISLTAIGPDQSLEQLFDTSTDIKPGRWQSIYVHQSLTSSGDAVSLGQDASGLSDHFLVGNGDPIANGAIQAGIRWDRQRQAGAVPGVDIRTDCISVCIVGDFNHSRPSLTQQDRIAGLISALQQKLKINSDHVFFGLDTAQGSVAGVGNKFPIAQIQAQLPQ